jgi:hypothetical protein
MVRSSNTPPHASARRDVITAGAALLAAGMSGDRAALARSFIFAEGSR